MQTINLSTEAFSSKQVCEITGITSRQLIYWDKQGYAKPTIMPAKGKGSQRLYSYADMLSLLTIKHFREEGISLQKIGKSVRYLRKHLPDISQPLNFCTLITDGDTVYLVEDEQTLIDTVRRQGQRVFKSLSITAIDHELRSKVLDLAKKRIHEITVGEYCYQVEIEPDRESGGYVATVAGLSGCITQGDSLEETLNMAADAIECWMEARSELQEKGIEIPAKKIPSVKKRAG